MVSNLRESKFIEARNVVWIQTAFIGDIILTTAAANAINRLRPEAGQYIVTTPSGKVALSESKLFKGVISFDKKGGHLALRKAIKEVKKLGLSKKDTVILQPHKSMRSSLLAWRLGFKTITYQETSFKIQECIKLPRVTMLHETARVKLLLEPLGISRESSQSFNPSLPARKLKKFMALSMGVIAIAPGSVWATKKWRLDGYVEVIKSILVKTPFKIVLLGSNAERKDAKFIMQRFEQSATDRIVDLVGQTDLADLCEIFPVTKAIVCNDSSPIHYASAFDVPTICIFGPTRPEMGFGPLASGSIVIESTDLDCRPCGDHGPNVCPLGHFNCMNNVSASTVFEALLKVLEVKQ